MNYPPPPGAPTFTQHCSGCGRDTLHFRHTDDPNDELGRGADRIPVNVYEVCTVCQHTVDRTGG